MAIHTFAAIYIGTYDVSLKVFEFTNRKKFHEVDHIRSRQELGKGAYGTGTIGYEQVEELCETLAQFKEIMESYKVDSYEVCAAAALRDTTNEIFVLDQIYLRTGFRVKVLSNSEHRFISYKAVAGSPVFEEMIKTSAAVVDVGGASVQITLFRDGKMITTQHMETGIMRLRNLLGDRGYSLKMYENQIEEYVNKKLEGFRSMYMNTPVDYLILISDYAGGLVKKIDRCPAGRRRGGAGRSGGFVGILRRAAPPGCRAVAAYRRVSGLSLPSLFSVVMGCARRYLRRHACRSSSCASSLAVSSRGDSCRAISARSSAFQSLWGYSGCSRVKVKSPALPRNSRSPSRNST